MMLNRLAQTLTTAVLAFVCPAVASDFLLQVDSRALVSRGDLIYLRPPIASPTTGITS